MNDMHFEGTIMKANFHPISETPNATLQLWIKYDVTEECFIEVERTRDELSKSFEFKIISGSEWDLSGLAGRRCEILRDAAGYHFIKYI